MSINHGSRIFSASNAIREIKWLLKLLNDFELPQRHTIVKYKGNTGCINLNQNEKYQSGNKQIDIRFYNIRHLTENGAIALKYCPSKIMIENIFSKLYSEQILPSPISLAFTNSEKFSEILLYFCYRYLSAP